MALQQIYSNNLDPSQPNLSQRFIDAIAFFITVPLSSFEIEIDCFLQVYIDLPSGEIARNLPLGKIEEQSIFLNKTDTETILTIPEEFQNTGLPMALLFLASDSVFLEAFAVKKEFDILDELTIINDKLNIIIADCVTPAPVAPSPVQQAFFFIN